MMPQIAGAPNQKASLVTESEQRKPVQSNGAIMMNDTDQETCHRAVVFTAAGGVASTSTLAASSWPITATSRVQASRGGPEVGFWEVKTVGQTVLPMASHEDGLIWRDSFVLRYIFLNQCATARGSNRTQLPILKHGMRPAFASLKTVIRETANNVASSAAVRA